ncbi:transmembrane emp24 domain-containing protein 1a isoform X2 [Colossoma macropomum]|uniref:transmembrane emp24 domain-containing protein 1a isoform X2 n=1 Tax=Colossoma macropomum TaxID=42526 RepID=UPI001863E8F1|nr:transmembrane emp24 domain-containing protein 1a isoform X2 [Colossoma macropomum]
MELSLTWLSFSLCVVLLLLLSVDFTIAFEKNLNTEFTFVLPAGRAECFFQPVTKNSSMEVEYQVLAGSGLDVGFTLISPHGQRLVSEFRKSDGFHMVDPTEEGDYRICFDNSFSTLVEKMVFMEVIVDSQEGADDWENLAEPEDTLGYKLDDIKEVMEAVHRNLERSGQTQAVLRAFEARDRYLLEDNLWRVSFWSSVNLLLILTVAFAQVYAVRRLF